MNKSITSAMLALPLVSALLLSTQLSSGQKQVTMKLQKSTQVKTAETSDKKIVQPTGQALVNRPDISVLPRNDPNKSTNPRTAQTQTSESHSESTLDSCSWSLLLNDEVGSYFLTITGTGCLGCRVGTDLSQTVPGVLGFSLSPTGPWTETLTVFTDLNFSGNGTSETFYIKGVGVGTSTFHGQNIWSSFDVEFHVIPCTCPEIPIVP